MNAIDARNHETWKTDLLVVGGGAAGVAAAVCAAREGMKVTLVERYGFCGGGAVAGLSGTICGLYEADENLQRAPNKVVFGFVDEFIAAMEFRSGLTSAIRYGKTYTRVHDPLVWREVADALVRSAGVHVVYHALVTDVLTEGDDVQGVRLSTKQGKVDIHARLVIDASGDADVVAMAGLQTFSGADGHVQNPTMMFRLQGVNVDKFMTTHGPDTIMGPDITQAMNEIDPNCTLLPRRKIFLFPTPRPGELLCNATRIVGSDGRELNPVVSADLTEAEFEGRKQVRAYERFIRSAITGCENAWVNDTGVQVGVRQSRQIEGLTRLSNDDVLGARKTPDGIARSPWPIEMHAGEKPSLTWIYRDFYEIPYGCFVPHSGNNILVAGRCLSAQHEAMASARVTAQCFSYGQAIGVAAALCVKNNLQPRNLKGSELRSELKLRGVQLD
jgi:glycine/D-amino acid oxidase-like deaminating enzyme